MSAKLYDFLSSTYGDKKARNNLENRGYVLDKRLSGNREKVYHNAQNNKTIVAVRGTKSYADVLVNDPAVALGILSKTNRYKHAQRTYNKTLEKYGDSKISVVGHSLGGSIVSHLKTRDEDQKITYNKGAGPRFLTGHEKNAKNEIALRNPVDLVSGFSSVAEGTKNIGRPHLNPFTAHSVEALKEEPLYL